MSATMQQALASLLVRKTEEGRAKARHNMETCHGAITTMQQVEQMSDLVSLVKTNIEKARNLLKEPPYLICLRCIANLNLLHDTIQDLAKLTSLYSKRMTLQRQRNDMKRNHEQYDESKVSLEKSLLDMSEQYEESKKSLEISIANTCNRQFLEGGNLKDLMLIIGYVAGALALYHLGFWGVGWDLLLVLFWPIVMFIFMLGNLAERDWDEALLGLTILAVLIAPLGIQKVFSKVSYDSRAARREELQRKITRLTKEYDKTVTETQERLTAMGYAVTQAEHDLYGAKSGVDDIDREISLRRDKIRQQATSLVW